MLFLNWLKSSALKKAIYFVTFINHYYNTGSNSSVKLRLLSAVYSHSQQQNMKGKFSNQQPKLT